LAGNFKKETFSLEVKVGNFVASNYKGLLNALTKICGICGFMKGIAFASAISIPSMDRIKVCRDCAGKSATAMRGDEVYVCNRAFLGRQYAKRMNIEESDMIVFIKIMKSYLPFLITHYPLDVYPYKFKTRAITTPPSEIIDWLDTKWRRAKPLRELDETSTTGQ
jgi:hypothetical protein